MNRVLSAIAGVLIAVSVTGATHISPWYGACFALGVGVICGMIGAIADNQK